MSQVIAILAFFAKVAWRPKNNYRSAGNYGEANAIRNSLALHEWVRDNPVPVTKITEAEIVAEVAERETNYANIKAKVAANSTPDSLAELAVFELLYTEEVDGVRKIIVPELSGNAGFRRASTFFAAMVQRFKDKAKEENATNEISGLIPVRVVEYKTNAERIIDQQQENEMQGLGTVKMADLDKLRVTEALYNEGCREVDVRRLYTSSTGQKTFGICQLNANWPKLNILKRFYLADTEPDYLPWGPVRHDKLVKLNARYEADRKRAEGFALKPDERAMIPVTEADVAAYLQEVVDAAKNGNAPPSMKKADMEQGSKNHKILLGRKFFDSVIQNTQSNLKPFMDYAEPLNDLTTLIAEGKGDLATTIIGNAKAAPELTVEIEKIVKAGKVKELLAAIAVILTAPSPVVETAPVVESTPVVVESTPAPTPEPTPAPKQGQKVKSGKS